MGRANRRKRQEFLRWAIVVGIIVSALFGWLLFYLSGRP
jgi:high-affinity Fe2+/Pb2+ permease